MSVRPDRRARRAYGVLGLVLALALSACALPTTPSVPDWTPTPPATPSTTPSPTPRVTRSPQPREGRPVQPIPSVRPNGYADPPAGSGLARYARQNLRWQPCGDGLTCAAVLAPLDYAKPDGPAITLALARREATSRRIGTLFVNPGGPGGSGTSYAAYFDREGLEGYDIVGWDPRGVGYSTPVVCMEAGELDRYYALDASPDDKAEERTRLAAVRDFGRSCLERSGGLLEHVSTVETVRDLDLLRGLVGDDRINFFGSSYGTRIGSLYAELYPDRVGRMVLDGSVNITGSDDEITQTEGFERALNNFATWCARQSCRLGDSRAAVLTRVKGYLDRLDAKPVAVGGRTLTQQLGVDGVFYSMYGGEPSWQRLRDALVAGIFDGDGKQLLALGDRSNFRRDDGSYDQLAYSFPAIRCLDSQDDSLREVAAQYARVSKAAPVLGQLGGADLTCALWPVASAAPPPAIDGAGARPIVVVGTTGDPATPYEYAVDMAERLKSGVLITFRGEGHLAYDQSDCVQRLVRDYLVRDQVPPDSRC